MTSCKPSTASKIHYLDSVRAGAMVLGIPFHAACVYAADHDWVVKSQQTSIVLFHFTVFIHSFRMPVFFFIAGFFSALTLGKASTVQAGHGLVPGRHARSCLGDRCVRLGVPLIATFTCLNLAELHVLKVWATAHDSASVITLEQPRAQGDLFAAAALHLWFLITLIIYSALAYVTYRLARVRLATVHARCRRASPGELLAILVAVATVINAFWRSMLLVPALAQALALTGFTSTILWTAFYAPFFLLGAYCHVDRRLLERLTRPAPLAIAASLVVLTLRVALPAFAPRSVDALRFALWTPSAFGGTYLVLMLGRAFFDRPSALTRELVDASFTIYLLHHVVVVLAAIALLVVDWPIAAEFTVMTLFALFTPWSVHLLCRRSAFYRFLFNGIRPETGKRRQVA